MKVCQHFRTYKSDWKKQNMFQKKLIDQITTQPNIDKLQSIACPVLLIKGMYDPICSEYQTEVFLQKVKNKTMKIFDNSAHMPRHEEPEIFAETIKSFIDSNARSTSRIR